MTNLEKYRQAFIEALEIEDTLLNDKLAFDSIPEWDSVGHMRLIMTLESMFDVTFDPKDIMYFQNLDEGKKILKKYGIEI